MSKPKSEVTHDKYFKDAHFLYEIFSILKDSNEQKKFIKDILTTTELRMLKRRWHIANLIAEGYDLRTVANLSGTSTQTVNTVKNKLEEGAGGLKVAIQRVHNLAKKEKKNFLKSKKRGGSKFVKSWF
jgi:TrpR-related protein YerC/YecD